MNNLIYYILLLFEKADGYIHTKFENKIQSYPSINSQDLKSFLWEKIKTNIVQSGSKYYYKTKISNKKNPVIVSQARLICLLCDDIELKGNNEELIKSLSDFLIKQQGNDGLFRFNNKSWQKQDEGIASVWSAIALIKAYSALKSEKYLDISLVTLESMFKYLYSQKTNLVHTTGQDFWCINSASKFAYLLYLILNYIKDEKYVNLLTDSVNICIDNIKEDGHFPYTEIYSDVYILLYQASVIFYLEPLLQSNFIGQSLKNKLQEKLNFASEYLIRQINGSFHFNEPDVKQYSHYIITEVTSLAALKNKIPPDMENKILSNITQYIRGNKLYLFIDDDGFLQNKSKYNFVDVYTVETLYWIVQYFNRQFVNENNLDYNSVSK